VVAILWLTGCGAVEVDEGPRGAPPVAGLGIEAYLPAGWTARILIGAEGGPVLHAASFPLPANDDDTGSARSRSSEAPAWAYVNVRDLGPAASGSALPVRIGVDDFGPPAGPAYRCCFIRVASRDVAVSGHAFRITAISGSNDPPEERVVETLNAFLSTLELEPYEPEPAQPARGGQRLDGHGIHLVLPPGWKGNVSHGLVELMGPGLELKLFENAGSDAPLVTARQPLQLVPTEFVPREPGSTVEGPAITTRSFIAAGRRFVLSATAGSLPPSLHEVAEANAALATLTVEPGDFYPGTVEPAAFAPAPGWHTGTSGPADVDPNSEGTFTWASTIPYRDPPNALPMQRTLDALPPDGIVIFVSLLRSHHWQNRFPDLQLPYDLAQAKRGPFEGVSAERATYRITARAPGGYDLILWVFFGRAEPTQEQLERAKAQLERLRQPDWRDSG